MASYLLAEEFVTYAGDFRESRNEHGMQLQKR